MQPRQQLREQAFNRSVHLDDLLRRCQPRGRPGSGGLPSRRGQSQRLALSSSRGRPSSLPRRPLAAQVAEVLRRQLRRVGRGDLGGLVRDVANATNRIKRLCDQAQEERQAELCGLYGEWILKSLLVVMDELDSLREEGRQREQLLATLLAERVRLTAVSDKLEDLD
jgi:hypothetical protein